MNERVVFPARILPVSQMKDLNQFLFHAEEILKKKGSCSWEHAFGLVDALHGIKSTALFQFCLPKQRRSWTTHIEQHTTAIFFKSTDEKTSIIFASRRRPHFAYIMGLYFVVSPDKKIDQGYTPFKTQLENLGRVAGTKYSTRSIPFVCETREVLAHYFNKVIPFFIEFWAYCNPVNWDSVESLKYEIKNIDGLTYENWFAQMYRFACAINKPVSPFKSFLDSVNLYNKTSSDLEELLQDIKISPPANKSFLFFQEAINAIDRLLKEDPFDIVIAIRHHEKIATSEHVCQKIAKDGRWLIRSSLDFQDKLGDSGAEHLLSYLFNLN